MSAEYKLHYFNCRGLGDVSRQLFALADVKFEDHRIEHADWPSIKPTTPFGQLPFLEVNGFQIPQSLTIARYLARKFGFSGKSAEEEAMVDAFADQFKDFYGEIRSFYYSKLGLLPNDPEVEKTSALIPARDKFLPILVKYLKKSQSGFLVDSGVTFADLIIVDNLRTLLNWWPEYANDYPEVVEWFKKVDNIPAIRKHFETSPKSDF